MNLNELTLGQIKELQSLFNSGVTSTNKPAISDHMIGKYVIVRTRNDGVNCGYLVAADETGVVIKDARRIWYHKPKDNKQCWYEGVANTGVSDDSKLSASVAEKIIIEDYCLTLCSDEGANSLKMAKNYEQN